MKALLAELSRDAWLTYRESRARSLLPDVREIVDAVRAGGDGALRDLTLRFDQVDLTGRRLRVAKGEIAAAARSAPSAVRADLEAAYRRLLSFHAALEVDAYATSTQGVRARLELEPLRRVGIYAPAGRAPLVSSVLMIAAAARAAGVGQIALASPPGPGGDLSPYILLAAEVAGIEEIYRVGGAQSIAAFAFGTDEIAAVDKIAGPGNRYVAAAKREVYGAVDVDLVAGPSEVLVIADGAADPDLIAADLLAQAEHDPDAEVALLALEDGLVEAVRQEITSQGRGYAVALESLSHATACHEPRLAEAIAAADAWAAEHLELQVRDPSPFIGAVRAGSIFVGAKAPTALGDYVAGPSHVLPTGQGARAFSGLTKLHFLRTFTVTEVDRVDRDLYHLARRLAELEGLPLHARSLQLRVDRKWS